MKRLFLLSAALLAFEAALFAQETGDEQAPVTFRETYDEPYNVNKFFIGFEPLYGELFVANVNAGYGMEAVYYYKDKLDFRGHFRKTYGRKFFDFTRAIAVNDNDADNRAEVFNYFELGATYHIRDFEANTTSKMFLYKSSYTSNRWASRVPMSAEVPCKVRKIYGVRLGGIMWDSSTDINRALKEQGLTNSDLGLPSQETDVNGELENVDLFTNIYATNIYLGGSMAWIRNIAVEFDEYESGVDDRLITVFADFLYAPVLTLDDIVYSQKDSQGHRIITSTASYPITPIKLTNFGFRLGLDGRFNRTLSWAYGAEVGYRPGIQGRTFFALFKISIPVYSTNLDHTVESFGK